MSNPDPWHVREFSAEKEKFLTLFGKRQYTHQRLADIQSGSHYILLLWLVIVFIQTNADIHAPSAFLSLWCMTTVFVHASILATNSFEWMGTTELLEGCRHFNIGKKKALDKWQVEKKNESSIKKRANTAITRNPIVLTTKVNLCVEACCSQSVVIRIADVPCIANHRC